MMETQKKYTVCPSYARYEMSEDGEIRERATKRVLPVTFTQSGFKRVFIRYGKKRMYKRVGEMYARTFVRREKGCNDLICVNKNWDVLERDNFRWVDMRIMAAENDKRDGVEWKEVEGFEKRYEVSNDGRIRSYKSCEEIAPVLVRGRLRVNLINNDGKRLTKPVSLLVAKAFIPNPYGYNSTGYKDGNYLNNTVDNIFWGKKPKKLVNTNNRIVDQYTKEGKYVRSYDSVSQASLKTNTNYKSLSQCCKGIALSAGGYVWRYGGEPFDKYRTPVTVVVIDGETFIEIPGSNGAKVSNMGRVMTGFGAHSFYNVDEQGNVCITIDGVRTHRRVSVLVAQAFIANPHNYKRVGFKDRDKSNCKADNLYWMGGKADE